MARHSSGRTTPLIKPLAYAVGMSIGSGHFDFHSRMDEAKRGSDLEQQRDDVAGAGLGMPAAQRSESEIASPAIHGAHDAARDQVRA